MIETEGTMSELPINRAIHWLRQGVPEQDITAERVGISDEHLGAVIETAKKRIIENDNAYSQMTRKAALRWIAFGIVILSFDLYLAKSDIPLLRQGRLILGFIIGAGSLGWGLFRFFNHDPRYEI